MSVYDSSRLPFIDWMKAAGICVIVVGHVAARTSDWMTPPIYPKQLGVAFFIFVTGYTLARERRPVWRVLLNRLFDIYVYGLLFALLWTAYAWFSWHDLAESNYLPFLGGINVIFNFFPANPSTWYVGTYLHILVLWAVVLRRVQVKPWILVSAGLGEIAIRAVLMERIGGVLPYMLLSNWLLVLLLGAYSAQRCGTHRLRPWESLRWAGVLIVVLAVWRPLTGSLVQGRAFPWMFAVEMRAGAGPVVVAAMVTVLYSGVSWLVFRATSTIEAPALVRTLSRHTLFIFIAHMPVFFVSRPLVASMTSSYAIQSVVMLFLCLPGLSYASSMLESTRTVRCSREAFARWLTAKAYIEVQSSS